jgi:hypothetical protein
MAYQELLSILQKRFENNMIRHKGLVWEKVETKLKANPAKLKVLEEMENTGGEPDVVILDSKTKDYFFVDCSPESPKGRRNTCYDHKAMVTRKSFPPKVNAEDMAKDIGIELLNEEQYRYLQNLGEFDLKTSSWILTPSEIRKHGGAIFADRRYDHVFVYHNGADSYYASRGFRGFLKV